MSAPPIELPSATEVFTQLRAWTPTLYRFTLYAFALVRQVPFIGTLLSILAGYMALLFIWRTVTSTIRTAFKMAKWASIVAALVAVWNGVSTGEDGAGGLMNLFHGNEAQHWIGSMLGGQESQSRRNSRASSYVSSGTGRSKTSRRNRRNTFMQSSTDETEDSNNHGLSETLAQVMHQVGWAAQWLSGESTIGWLKEQWDAMESQAQEIDQDVDRRERSQKSWF